MYIDSNGIMRFTNMPTSSDYKIFIKNREEKKTYFPKSYDLFIKSAAEKHGIDFSLLKAIVKVESDFNPNAVSKSGAIGLMQLMPVNIKAFNVSDPFDPEQNIMCGSRYLKKLLDRFDGKLPMALAAYNAGPTLVNRYKGVPPFPETENYVYKVMKFYNALKQ